MYNSKLFPTLKLSPNPNRLINADKYDYVLGVLMMDCEWMG